MPPSRKPGPKKARQLARSRAKTKRQPKKLPKASSMVSWSTKKRVPARGDELVAISRRGLRAMIRYLADGAEDMTGVLRPGEEMDSARAYVKMARTVLNRLADGKLAVGIDRGSKPGESVSTQTSGGVKGDGGLSAILEVGARNDERRRCIDALKKRSEELAAVGRSFASSKRDQRAVYFALAEMYFNAAELLVDLDGNFRIVGSSVGRGGGRSVDRKAEERPHPLCDGPPFLPLGIPFLPTSLSGRIVLFLGQTRVDGGHWRFTDIKGDVGLDSLRTQFGLDTLGQTGFVVSDGTAWRLTKKGHEAFRLLQAEMKK